eukprot:CAMPEP_0168461602 /NCGR_PEP_ID=MMETSP0228-20121227/54068_1 /TAXON_ID=133427 /ORGANISM="Protoceratium reticulatum, Strain CCCM 535 (=CCMP 1889)" /LENGTH=89 /DNA_ID=CAMNT_0008476919 /DNA_START=69 /DNA_END=335 /DNA_ORIENTATION=+
MASRSSQGSVERLKGVIFLDNPETRQVHSLTLPEMEARVEALKSQGSKGRLTGVLFLDNLETRQVRSLTLSEAEAHVEALKKQQATKVA